MCYRDSGALRILGRVGELINVGGEKLMPAEVETVLLTVPGVRDCRVAGEPSALTGQTVVADVVLAPGHDAEVVRAALRSLDRDEREYEETLATLHASIHEDAACRIPKGDVFPLRRA